MKKIKAAFFDIDGTLIPFGKERIPESTLDALNQLRNKGIKLFVATGRPPISLDHIHSQFQFDGFLALNGQYCIYDNKVIRKSVINKEEILNTLSYFDEKNITVIFVEKDYLYLNFKNDNYNKFYETWTPANEPTDSYERIKDNDVYQMITFVDEKDEPELFKYLPHCKAARWNPFFTDVIPYDGGKNKGIDEIIKYLNISLDESIAFGDGGNDSDMLKHVGIGVAMGNALDSVKEIADYVTDDVDRDGIMNALKHFDII